VKQRFAALVGVVALSVAAISIYLGRGVTYAIDFRGGAIFTLQSTEPINPQELQSFLQSGGTGVVSIAQTADPGAVLLISAGKIWDRESIANLQLILKQFDSVQIVQTEIVGPVVGGELRRAALVGIGLAVAGGALWILLRFGWQFGAVLVLSQVLELAQLLGFASATQLSIDIKVAFVVFVLIVCSFAQKFVVFKQLQKRASESLRQGNLGDASVKWAEGTVFGIAVIGFAATVGISAIMSVGFAFITLSTMFAAPALVWLLGGVPAQRRVTG